MGFPHMAQSSHQLPVPLSLSLSEDGDTFGGSPAVWQKKKSCLCLAAPDILPHDLVVEGGHLAAGFPCKVGPGTLQRIFSGATYSTVCFDCFLLSVIDIPLSFREGHSVNNLQMQYD